MNKPKKRTPTALKMPKFINEDEEAKWWAGAEGREFLKRQSGAGTAGKRKGSPLVSGLKPRRQRGDRADQRGLPSLARKRGPRAGLSAGYKPAAE